MHAAGAAYTVGLLGGYLSRRGGAYATKALAVGAATAGYKFGQWWKGSSGVKSPMVQYRRKNPVRGGVRKVQKNGRRSYRKKFTAGRSGRFGVLGKRTAGVAFSAGAGGRVVKRRYNKRRVRSASGYGGEYGPTSIVTGRVGRGRKLPRRQLKLGYQKIISRWQNVSPMTDSSDTVPPGMMWLEHQTDGTSTFAPMKLFLLNQTQNGTVAYGGGPCFNVAFNDTGGLVITSRNSQLSTGGLAANGDWQPEVYDPELSGENMRYIMAAWYDIRVQAYGCTSQPTVYDIMIIQFQDQYLDPLETPSNAQEVADRHAVYQSMVQKYMSNPIMPVIAGRKKYSVLKRVRFVIQSTKTDENDKDPSCRQVKMFLRDGNMYDYRYHDDGFGGAGADNKLSTVQWAVQGASTVDYTNVPNPKARKWLVVRAMNTTRQSLGSEITSANTPSFNLIVRKAEYQLNGN